MQAEGKVSTSAPALTRAMKDANPMTQADSVHSTPPTNTSAIDDPKAAYDADFKADHTVAMAQVQL
jgi:hypothetical protein